MIRKYRVQWTHGARPEMTLNVVMCRVFRRVTGLPLQLLLAVAVAKVEWMYCPFNTVLEWPNDTWRRQSTARDRPHRELLTGVGVASAPLTQVGNDENWGYRVRIPSLPRDLLGATGSQGVAGADPGSISGDLSRMQANTIRRVAAIVASAAAVAPIPAPGICGGNNTTGQT